MGVLFKNCVQKGKRGQKNKNKTKQNSVFTVEKYQEQLRLCNKKNEFLLKHIEKLQGQLKTLKKDYLRTITQINSKTIDSMNWN